MNEEIAEEQESKDENNVAGNLKVLGVLIIIAGFIGGVVFLAQTGDTSSLSEPSDFEKMTFRISAFVSAASGIISGSLFIGISEIIKLLHEINLK